MAESKLTKWEHLVELKVGDELDQGAELDSRGAEGWELVAVLPGYFYFKRPLQLQGGSEQ